MNHSFSETCASTSSNQYEQTANFYQNNIERMLDSSFSFVISPSKDCSKEQLLLKVNERDLEIMNLRARIAELIIDNVQMERKHNDLKKDYNDLKKMYDQIVLENTALRQRINLLEKRDSKPKKTQFLEMTLSNKNKE